MRFFMLVGLSVLSACASVQSGNENSANDAALAGACIDREAAEIATRKVDLETAATAVIAKCSTYTEATRRDLIARYPGYRDYMAPKLRELDQVYFDRARRAVALARTR